MLQQYLDILANVRRDGKYHSIRRLVQPDDAEVMAIAAILSRSDDFIAACQDFVDSFTTYAMEVGDYWATPEETMAPHCPVCDSGEMTPVDDVNDIWRCSCGWSGKPLRWGDCDDKAILLTSLLRTEIPADKVYCAVGNHVLDGRKEGHMWVIVEGRGQGDRIVEATAPSGARVKGDYDLMMIFNDALAFSYPQGLQEFNLQPVTLEHLVRAQEAAWQNER